MPSIMYLPRRDLGELPGVAALGNSVAIPGELGWTDPLTQDWETILDGYQAAGLHACVPVNYLTQEVVAYRPSKVLTAGEITNLQTLVNMVKDHPATWGYYMSDEGFAADYPISTRQQAYNAIKAVDPGTTRKVLEVSNPDFCPGTYSPDCHDIFGLDFYVGSNGGSFSNLSAWRTHIIWCLSQMTGYATDDVFIVMQAFSGGGYCTVPAGGTAAAWAIAEELGLDSSVAWFQYRSGGGLTGLQDMSAGVKAETAAINALFDDLPFYLTITPTANWTQSGTTLTVTAPRGVRTTCTASVVSTLGGTLRFTGTHASRFSASLNGADFTATVEVPAGTTTVYLGVTPEATDGGLTVQVGVWA